MSLATSSARPVAQQAWLWSTAQIMSSDDTGIVVRPPRGGGGGQERAATVASGPRSRWATAATALIGAVVGAGGMLGGLYQRLESERSSAEAASKIAVTRSNEAEAARQAEAKAVVEAKAAGARAEAAQTELATARATAEKAIAEKAKEAQELESKLAALVGEQGEVSQAGGAIRLELVDKVLFSTGNAELTERGKKMLGKVGSALAELSDKQIWVQGHTDDQPITPDKGVQPTFPTNWELSAARALTVVHYLQEVSKIDPQRLAAVAFGEYRPISRTRAKNRRIELVLYPKIDVRPR